MSSSTTTKTASDAPVREPEIWWSNAIFFSLTHIAAIVGVYYYPPTAVPWQTLVFAFLTWQLADFGITMGYHRLYSHRAYRAALGVRVVLALLGTIAFQGSIKWWCLRHRLHHVRIPVTYRYAATRGLFYSHMGWIFYKPVYERIGLVDRQDLDSDPVPLAVSLGFVAPSLIGMLWSDPVGTYIWAGLVARLFSALAHWDGLQPYSDENTSRGNLILALLTGGEGNHNFHTFPHDYRSGPSYLDWDPTKWIIAALHRLGFVKGLRRARDADLRAALAHMQLKGHHHHETSDEEDDEPWTGPVWGVAELKAKASQGACLLIIEGYVVDATAYLGEHPGGASILRKYAYSSKLEETIDATWAFEGGLNNHSWPARRGMRELRVAKFNVD
uniref:Cytochrome b5 heme-binding domain-containing protein n=1 Tax=Schizophyllum commune (strain H4-8 / FGSC 9210) TaxID=578458 RepID=D8PRD9_SCHCM